MGSADRRAGDQPVAGGELLALLPIGRRPDVLGMGRDAPGLARHEGGIAGDGGRGVQEMGVQPRDARRQLGRQHQRLAEAPAAVGRRVAAEVGQPGPERRADSPAGAAPATSRPARGPARARDIPADR